MQRRARADLEEHAAAAGRGSVRMPSANRTASRTCRRQYPGSAELFRRRGAPGHVRDDRNPRRGITIRRDHALELVEHRLHQRASGTRARRPAAASRRRAAEQPLHRRVDVGRLAGDDDVAPAPLTAAIDDAPAFAGDGRPRTSASVGEHRRHRARPAAPASAGRARRPASAPSSSVNTPATQAATYSPTLWPSTAAGLDAPGAPQLARARTRPRTAPAACTPSVVERRRRLRPYGTATSSSGTAARPRSSRVAALERGAEHRLRLVQLAAHAGVLRALPVNRKATRGARCGAIAGRSIARLRPPATAACSAARASSRSTRAITASDARNARGRRSAVNATSASGVGRRRRVRRSTAAPAPRSASASAPTASGRAAVASTPAAVAVDRPALPRR